MAKVATQPSTLRLRFDMFVDKFEKVEEQLINKKTGEELSLSIIDNRFEWPVDVIEIEINRKRVASKQQRKM